MPPCLRAWETIHILSNAISEKATLWDVLVVDQAKISRASCILKRRIWIRLNTKMLRLFRDVNVLSTQKDNFIPDSKSLVTNSSGVASMMLSLEYSLWKGFACRKQPKPAFAVRITIMLQNFRFSHKTHLQDLEIGGTEQNEPSC